MAGDPHAAAAARLLARLGREAVVRGAEQTLAYLAHGVAVLGDYGEVAERRSVATLPADLEIRVGDVLTVEASAWVVDAILDSDGYTVSCVVRPA